jgi:hypothetical protein
VGYTHVLRKHGFCVSKPFEDALSVSECYIPGEGFVSQLSPRRLLDVLVKVIRDIVEITRVRFQKNLDLMLNPVSKNDVAF